MIEIPHCELERFHYQALSNRSYQIEGLNDVLYEEMMMNMPNPKEVVGFEPTPEPEWSIKQWDKVQQLESEIVGWRKKHAEALSAIDKLTKRIEGGGDLT